MTYVDNLRMLYGYSVELHKVPTYEYKYKMDTNKLGVVGFLDKDEVACGDDDMVACLDEGVLAFLDRNDKDNCDVYFFHVNPLK